MGLRFRLASRKFVGTFFRLTVLFVLFSIVACSGGGGDSGGSKNGRSAATGIRLIHAALDFPPLQINTAQGGVASSGSFGEPAFHGGPGAGQVNFVVAPVANPAQGLFTAATSLVGGQHRSVLAYAGFETQDIRFNVIDDRAASVPAGQSAVRVINGVSNTSTVKVQVGAAATTAAAPLGAASEYVLVPSGPYDLVLSSGSGQIGKVGGVLESGASYSVVGHGAGGYFVTTKLLLD